MIVQFSDIHMHTYTYTRTHAHIHMHMYTWTVQNKLIWSVKAVIYNNFRCRRHHFALQNSAMIQGVKKQAQESLAAAMS